MITKLDTTNWKEFNFTIDGINFVSKVDPLTNMYQRILNAGVEIFIQMNIHAIKELIGDPTKLSYKDLDIELGRINHGATEALVELVA